MQTMLNNDNVVSKRNYNDNVTMNNVIGRNQQDQIADRLCEELGNHQYRAFYCKVAYNLSEAQIWNSLEIAKKGKDHSKYFTWLVKKQMKA